MLLSGYEVFGLVYESESNVVAVPIEGVMVDAHIVEFCVRTRISQLFRNTSTATIQTKYVFPLDERAAVCGFESDIDGFDF